MINSELELTIYFRLDENWNVKSKLEENEENAMR